MGRAPSCEKLGLNRGPWTTKEDEILIDYINQNGHGNWRKLPKQAGLLRCGKSCRLRWINYLRPDVKREEFTGEEEDTLIKLHRELGNKWSTIAKLMPGRTDNQIKNVWNTRLKKKVDNIIPLVIKKRSRKRSKIEKVVTQNIKTPQVQNAQDSTSDDKSINHFIHATIELIKSGDRNSANMTSSNNENSSSSVSMATNYNYGTSCSSSTTSAISAGLSKFLEIEDDFSWSEVISSEDLTDNIIPFFNGSLHDDKMEFWYNIYTSDGGIDDLLQDYP